MRRRGLSLEALSEDLWLSEADLRSLHAAGHIVGLHSFDHPSTMADLEIAEQRQQYERNRRHLELICDTPVYSAATLDLLQELGVLVGFRSNMQPPDGIRINPTPLEFAREDATNILRQIECETSGIKQ
jgi:hypothetical protein